MPMKGASRAPFDQPSCQAATVDHQIILKERSGVSLRQLNCKLSFSTAATCSPESKGELMKNTEVRYTKHARLESDLFASFYFSTASLVPRQHLLSA